jgi:hypothetical protein
LVARSGSASLVAMTNSPCSLLAIMSKRTQGTVA